MKMHKRDVETVLLWFQLQLRRFYSHPDKEAVNRLQGFTTVLQKESVEEY